MAAQYYICVGVLNNFCHFVRLLLFRDKLGAVYHKLILAVNTFLPDGGCQGLEGGSEGTSAKPHMWVVEWMGKI
ncbi:MAG: hypothetical protein WAM60_27180 [Candidatus Promineifilaceae bacterium]